MRTAIAVLIEPRTVGVSMHPDLSLSKGLACSTGWPGTKRSLVTALRAGHLGRSPLLTARLSGHQVMINGHALSPPLSFVAAIPVGPSRGPGGAPAAKRGRTTWTVGGHLMRPPQSRNVAERRAT